MRNRSLPRLAWLALIAICLAGCHSNPDKLDRPENPFKTAQDKNGKKPLSDRELRAQADELYRHARAALDSSDYSTAITRYDQLIARYPFSDYSTQAELERVYAQYKSFQSDEATAAADRFLRSHPRHPHADYVQYIKGLTDFERDAGILTYLKYDNAKRDVSSQVRAFEDFALLLQKYPTSRYAGDARRRMLYSRNRIAEHELSVARFYVSRGAYVAAAKRANDIIVQYPGAPATTEALEILQHSYAKLDLKQQAKDAGTLIAANDSKPRYTDPPSNKTPVMVADQAASAPATTQPGVAAGPAAHEGAFTRFAHVFDIFDSSKPENQHTIVVGDGTAAPAGNPPADTASAPAPASAPPTSDGSIPATAAPPAQPAAAPVHEGAFTRFAHLFNIFDTSKPENQRTIVIGGDKTPPAAPADAKPGTAATPAAADSSATTTHFDLTYIPPGQDDQPANAAANAPATPASANNTPAATPPQQQAPPEKKGFFTWFAGLFSFLDPDQREPAQAPAQTPPPAPAPTPTADTKPAGSGS